MYTKVTIAKGKKTGKKLRYTYLLIIIHVFSRLALNAFDLDVGFNAMLEYTIVDDVARNMFKIDSTTGGIQILQNLDYEKKSNYSFYVTVSVLFKIINNTTMY